MEDEKTQFWIFGVIIAAITGIYGIFVKHLFNHISVKSVDNLEKDIEKCQPKATCDEIVKRQDENNKEVHNKLDRILEWIDSHKK